MLPGRIIDGPRSNDDSQKYMWKSHHLYISNFHSSTNLSTLDVEQEVAPHSLLLVRLIGVQLRILLAGKLELSHEFEIMGC